MWLLKPGAGHLVTFFLRARIVRSLPCHTEVQKQKQTLCVVSGQTASHCSLTDVGDIEHNAEETLSAPAEMLARGEAVTLHPVAMLAGRRISCAYHNKLRWPQVSDKTRVPLAMATGRELYATVRL